MVNRVNRHRRIIADDYLIDRTDVYGIVFRFRKKNVEQLPQSISVLHLPHRFHVVLENPKNKFHEHGDTRMLMTRPNLYDALSLLRA